MPAVDAPSHPLDTSRILDAHGNLRPRLLTELLDHAVAKFPQRVCVDFLGREWTYAQIGELVDRIATGLQAEGLGQGDRFGLCLPNTPYSVILYFAVLRAGATVVNINPLYSESEVEFLVTDSGAKMVAVPDLELLHGKVAAAWGKADEAGKVALEKIVLCPMADVLPFWKGVGLRTLKRSALAKRRAGVGYLDYRALAAHPAAPKKVEQHPDDVAVLQYTGGTTGRPKGAMLTHANLAANSAQMMLHVGEERDMQERTLGVLPLFHVFALTCVLNFGVDTAAELVLLPRFDMDEVLKTIRRKPPTQMFGVPTIYNALGSLPDDKVPDLSAVRTSISGGAPLPLEIRQQYEKRTGSPVSEGYGLTEASPIITSNPLLGRQPVKDNSAGPAFPHTIIEIRNPETGECCVGVGEKGEICARGPQVMKGYWNQPEATAATFVDGALKTGDIGYLDKDGYLFIVDRIKDLILCSGYNVYPRVIEDAAYEHPAVKEAVAIGIPDDYRGEAPKLFIALHPGEDLDAATLHAFLKMRLNPIEMPDAYEFRDELPKTLVGKLEKKALVAEERAKAEICQGGKRMSNIEISPLGTGSPLADNGDESLKSIAEAAEELGVTQRTLRFYEDKGLIAPQRVGTMRVYSRREMGRMMLILRGKRLGFSIREIGEFLSLYDTDQQQLGQMRHLVGRVTDRLGELRQQREAIEQTIRELETVEAQATAHIARLAG